MIIPTYYATRNDGVNLIKRIAGSYDEDGVTIIPSGFMIHKIGTDEYYAEAIDVEDAPWEYEETDILIERDEFEQEEVLRDGISDAEFRAIIEEAM